MLKKMSEYELNQVVEAYKIIDRLTDEIESEHPDNTFYPKLSSVWVDLYETIEEQIGEENDVDKFVYGW